MLRTSITVFLYLICLASSIIRTIYACILFSKTLARDPTFRLRADLDLRRDNRRPMVGLPSLSLCDSALNAQHSPHTHPPTHKYGQCFRLCERAVFLTDRRAITQVCHPDERVHGCPLS